MRQFDVLWCFRLVAQVGAIAFAAKLSLVALALNAEAAFVAGSGYDMFGTASVGLRTYWHNRVGLARPEGAPLAEVAAGGCGAVDGVDRENPAFPDCG